MALPPLPEDRTSLNRFRAVNGSMSSQHSPNSDRLARHNSDKGVDRGSLTDRVHSDRVKQVTLETAGLYPLPPPSALSSYQAQAISNQYSPDSYGRYQTQTKHFSTGTVSSTSSASSRRPGGKGTLVPSSPVGTEYSFVLEDSPRQLHPSMAQRLQSSESMSTIHTFGNQSHQSRMLAPSSSIDSASIITSSSGASDKKSAKAEKKA